MSDESSAHDIDFEDTMKQLSSQFDSPKGAAPAKSERADILLGLGEMVRPLALELEVIKRAGSDNNRLITALHKTLSEQKANPHALDSLAEQMKRLATVESGNVKLFDALHAELKTYKDNFLFDALQKPFIRDLVTLFDDFTAVHAQTGERLQAVAETDPGSDEAAFLKRIYGNLENNLHHILEVFLRMDVTIVQTPVGAPIDKKVHRAVSVAPAATPADDSLIERSVRPGFFWHERSVRPEDVVVRRWTAPAPDPLPESARETVLIEPILPEPGESEIEASPR